MNPPSTDPQAVKLSASFYNLLLASYPTRFRQEYGPHMLQVFRDCCRKAYQNGGLPRMLWLWALTFFDYLQSVIEEHTQRGVHMNKEKFIRLSGWALIVGAFAWVLGFAAGNIQEYNPYNALSRPFEKYFQYLVGSEEILIPAALILILVGILGLYQRYTEQAGRLGRSGLVITISGSVIALLAYALMLFTKIEYFWLGLILGMPLSFSGIAIFGISALKSRFLSQLNFTPLMIGLCGLPAVFGLGDALFVVTGIGFLMLGYMLQSDTREKPQPAAG